MSDSVWSAVYEEATGVLRSVGTVVADDETLTQLGLVRVDLPGNPGSAIWNVTTHSFDPIPKAVPVLTRIEYMRLFTIVERIGLRSSQNPVVQDLLWLVDNSETIRMDDPDVIRGLDYLVSVELIGPERPAQILSGEVPS